jgi:low affinity Fe/Cu permease
VRLKVATAVGEICKYDFNLVLDNIVCKWANTKDLKLQALAALALYIPLCDSVSTMTVISLLQNWSQPHSSDGLRITSILAYRNYVSLYLENLAITNLFGILLTSSSCTFYAAAEAICDFFESGATESERYFLVLDTMCTIFKGETRDTSLAAICCLFAILLQNCYTYSLDANRKVSTLLWLLQQEQALVRSSVDQVAPIKYQPCIAMLIRIAVNHDMKLRKVILNELSDWLQLADKDRQFFSPTGNLIYKVYIGESIHGQARILAFLNNCSLRDNSPSAREILLGLS